MRSAAWIVFLCCTLAAGCSHAARKRPGIQPHNVLLITASSLRADHLSAWMYARPTGAWPATEEEKRQGRALSLDDLAEQGVMFADASSGAVRAFPAACQLMTGTRCASSGDPRGDRPDDRLYDPPLGNGATTLAERFHDAGFATAAFVAGSALHDGRGLDQGFDLWFARITDMAVLEAARVWLTYHEHDAKPWFVWVHLAGCDPPHDPRGLPPLPGDVPGVLDFGRLYSDPDYHGPAEGGSPAYLARLSTGEAVASDADRARLVDLYDGEIARLAACVRNLALAVRNLDEQGTRWNDTLFVFAGLHGIELGDTGPRAWGNAELRPPVVATPLILRHPLSLTGSRIQAEPVGLEDVAPTICEWLGLPALPERPRCWMGRSLLPLVDTYVERPFEHRPAYSQLNGENPMRSLRTHEYTIVKIGPTKAQQYAIYDRIADPREQHDLSAERTDLYADLRAALARATFDPSATQ